MATAIASSSTSQLRVIRKPSLRVRQAVRDNNVSLLSRLQHKTDLRNTDKERLTSLGWAALEGNLEVFEWLLLDYGHDDQELSRDGEHNTILHLLASVPSPPGCNPLVRPSPGFPPPVETRSHQQLTRNSLRMTELYHTLFPFLLDWSNSDGKTALHVAAQAGNASFIALLCDLGADPELSDLQGNAPLHYASAWGNIECARVLLASGCASSTRNFEGFTPADYAYSTAVKTALEAVVREVVEERSRRREQERKVGNRLRSGSVSTSASVGSGLSLQSGKVGQDVPSISGGVVVNETGQPIAPVPLRRPSLQSASAIPLGSPVATSMRRTHSAQTDANRREINTNSVRH